MTIHTFPAGHRAGKTHWPVATAVERDAGSRYVVYVRFGVIEYDVTVIVFGGRKEVLGCWGPAGYPASGARRTLVEQAAREAVLT